MAIKHAAVSVKAITYRFFSEKSKGERSELHGPGAAGKGMAAEKQNHDFGKGPVST